MLGSFFKNRELESTDAYYQARRAYDIDPDQDFVRVKNRIGLAGAMVYAQIYFSNQNRYKRFRREIELHKENSNRLNRDFDVLLVLPPRGSLTQPVIQQMKRQSMGLATSAGFSFVSQAQLNTDRVIHGAKRLHQLILEKKRQNRKVLLVSFSFGSAFVRVMLDKSEASDLTPIKGWMNLSGLIFGSPRFDCSNKVRMFFNTTPSQRTFSCEQNHFKNKIHNHKIKTVHFLGLKSSLSNNEWRDREKLRAWGPNDGVIPFSPYQSLQQPVIPLLDQGHVIDLSKLSMTFIQTLSSMVSTLPVPDRSLGHAQLKGMDFISTPQELS